MGIYQFVTIDVKKQILVASIKSLKSKSSKQLSSQVSYEIIKTMIILMKNINP